MPFALKISKTSDNGLSLYRTENADSFISSSFDDYRMFLNMCAL
jgi:hypothetical protein